MILLPLGSRGWRDRTRRATGSGARGMDWLHGSPAACSPGVFVQLWVSGGDGVDELN